VVVPGQHGLGHRLVAAGGDQVGKLPQRQTCVVTAMSAGRSASA
jgi:hypothetical protein